MVMVSALFQLCFSFVKAWLQLFCSLITTLLQAGGFGLVSEK
jgi:hypothetical protein